MNNCNVSNRFETSFIESLLTQVFYFIIIVILMSRIDCSNENSEINEIYKRRHKNPQNSEISPK